MIFFIVAFLGLLFFANPALRLMLVFVGLSVSIFAGLLWLLWILLPVIAVLVGIGLIIFAISLFSDKIKFYINKYINNDDYIPTVEVVDDEENDK